MPDTEPNEPPPIDGELVDAPTDEPADEPAETGATGESGAGGAVDRPLLADPTPPVPSGDYTDQGVPTLDYVRDRIEGKYTTSIGATELAGETPEGRAADEQFTKRQQAGRDKLEEIRRAMRGE